MRLMCVRLLTFGVCNYLRVAADEPRTLFTGQKTWRVRYG